MNPCSGQSQLDSLWNVWSDTIQTNRIRLESLCKYAEEYRKENTDSSLYYAEKAYKFATEKDLEMYRNKSKTLIGEALYRKGDYENAIKVHREAIGIARQMGDSSLVAHSLSNIGKIFYVKSDYNKALGFFKQSLALSEALDDKLHMGGVLTNIGIINIIQQNYDLATKNLNRGILLYSESENPDMQIKPMANLAILKRREGNYPEAIALNMKCLAIDEKNGDEFHMAYSYFNIAAIYHDQGELSNFIDYTNKSLEIRRKLDHKSGIVSCLMNLGAAYIETKDYAKAQSYFNECQPIVEELGDKKNYAQLLLYKSTIQLSKDEFNLAKEGIDEAYEIFKEIENNVGVSRSLKALGLYYKAIGNKQKSIEYFTEGLALAKNADLEQTKEISFELFQMYKSIGNSKSALKAYELFILSRDSISNKDNQRIAIRQEFKYEYEKQAILDSISFANQKQIQNTKLEKTKTERKTLLIVLTLVIGFSAVLFNRMRLVKKQKSTIENQNLSLNDLNESLEQKVIDRTEEISKINTVLTSNEERYRYALEATNEGIWDWHIVKNTIEFSPSIYTMLGYEPYEFEQTRSALYDRIHSEEDSAKYHIDLHESLKNTRNDEQILDEYRMKTKTGKLIWIQSKGKVVERDELGRPIRMVGTNVDITASKLKNQELLEAILKAEDSERNRISKDIHDGLQQTLTISLLNFELVKKEIFKLGTLAVEKFETGWQYLQESITESRSIAHDLMPKAIVDFGVIPAFISLIDQMNKASDKIEFNFVHNFKEDKIENAQIETTLYRILQETINNIVKHSKASKVEVQLKHYDDMYMLTIEDDGQGFDVKKIYKDGKGIGFKSMQNRLDAINGFLDIDSQPGRGTNIVVQIEKI
ncbi:tetratricopeptide repeat protein [Lutimonas sp.]|uniref:tetratricopeptide repeat protein n=1 Tax=Lutimonas sp. TaxID=1872403 RepID=UPI003D9B7D97